MCLVGCESIWVLRVVFVYSKDVYSVHVTNMVMGTNYHRKMAPNNFKVKMALHGLGTF